MIYAISKTNEFSAETLEQLGNKIVEHYLQFKGFDEIDCIIDENDNEIKVPANFNDELKDIIDRARQEADYYDMSDIKSDYLRSVL